MVPKPNFLETEVKSSLGLHYYTNRHKPFPSGETWLEGKRIDDDIGDLWRVHDGLYDLTNFITKHPGGPEWLSLTKGTDITEAFETHHLKAVDKILSKYFVRKATNNRLSTFTFHEDDFYRSLKRKVTNELPSIPRYVIQRSKLIADAVVALYLSLCVLATIFESYQFGIMAGLALAWTINISHNFIHQKDNFRMYYLDLSMMSSREFRITHILSHHLFPNTIHDIEISMFEPVLKFLPQKKTSLQKYISWLYAFLLFPLLSVMSYVGRMKNEKTVNINTLVPWATLLLTYTVSGQSFMHCFTMFFWIITWGSFFFGLIGKTAAHHHPDIFHDGDTPRSKQEMDFGVHQLDAVSDRPNIQGSPFLVLTNFGDHALHHLFPTLDHGVLDYLYPTFLQTCLEFGVDWKLFSSIELVKGAWEQLARDTPNIVPPQSLKKKFTTNSKR